MALELSPSDTLVFQRPLIHENKAMLLLVNSNAEAVIYKIKTTAPDQYCVNPSRGTIDRYGRVDVEVTLKPFKADPPPYFQCKHKFLVESAKIQREFVGVSETAIWLFLESQYPTQIYQSKLQCAFADPTDSHMPETTTPTENVSCSTTMQNFAHDKPQPPIPFSPIVIHPSPRDSLQPFSPSDVISISSDSSTDALATDEQNDLTSPDSTTDAPPTTDISISSEKFTKEVVLALCVGVLLLAYLHHHYHT